MGTLLFVVLSLLAAVTPAPYAELKEKGEAFVAEKSFAKAHAVYEEASHLALTPEEKRWVAMRLADTAWRADEEPRDEARKALEEIARSEDHDRIYAEANESLGDYVSQRRTGGDAMQWYGAALGWWAGSDDLPLARKRYLGIVFRISGRGDEPPYERIAVPKEVLANAVAIAETADDRAHARLLYALSLMTEYRPEPVERALELLDEVIAMGKTTSRYDQALYTAATELSQPGGVVVEDGQAAFKPDYVKSLALYHRIVNEFTSKESRYYENAQRMIESIEQPSVAVLTAGTFLPSSEQEVQLNWRNVKAVDFDVIAIDLTKIVVAAKRGNWIDQLPSTGSSVRRWRFDTNDRGDHAIGNQSIRIPSRLEPGAYVVVAWAGNHQSKALLLVTDANIVLHHARGRIDAFVCNAVTGEPMANAHVRLWHQTADDVFKSTDAMAGADGVVTIPLAGDTRGMVTVFASSKNRQAWVSTWDYSVASDHD
ncbi:MAG TPA: hypothetical protein VH087_10510, partial [Thermoanaerobaculia bacterium]|nr:hypothetical protein [Thermoanaerobaculia bacterium]